MIWRTYSSMKRSIGSSARIAVKKKSMKSTGFPARRACARPAARRARAKSPTIMIGAPGKAMKRSIGLFARTAARNRNGWSTIFPVPRGCAGRAARRVRAKSLTIMIGAPGKAAGRSIGMFARIAVKKSVKSTGFPAKRASAGPATVRARAKSLTIMIGTPGKAMKRSIGLFARNAAK